MDLTDITVPPMIGFGMGATIVAIKLITGWSLPFAIALGIVPGYAIGVVAGLLIAALFGSLIDFLFFCDRVRKGR